MPVDAPQITIDPYKSQVPLVQIPQEDLQRAQPMPEQAGYMGKAGSVMEISDSLMKGALKGLQMKEEKKYKTAQAVMGAQDAAISDTKKRYEDSLVTKGADDAGTKAAWEAYTKTVNEAAEARQAFAVPEKTAKPAKGQKKDKKAADGAPAAGGFGAGLKQFFERNPHIIPELSIIGMKSQVDPKLYGQMTPELIARKADTERTQQEQEKSKLVLDTAKQHKADEDNYRSGFARFNNLSTEEVKGLPPDVKKEYDSWVDSKAALTPMKHSMATATYRVPDGSGGFKFEKAYIDDPPPDGELYVAGATPKIGTEQDFSNSLLKEHGYSQENAPAMAKKFAKDYWDWKQAMITSGAHEVLQPDPKTGQQVAVMVGGSTTRAGKRPDPKDYGLPPDFLTTSFTIAGQESPKQGGGITPPPQASPQQAALKAGGKMTAPPSATQRTAAPKAAAGKGAMTPPPSGIKGVRNTGVGSLAVTRNAQQLQKDTQAVEDKERQAYATATQKRDAALAKIKVPDKATYDKMAATVLDEYEKAKAQIVLWKAAQIKAIGGNPWKATANNGKYGSMDGVNWVDVQTGMPYQEPQDKK